MHFLPRNLEEYAEAHTEPEPPLLAELRRTTYLGTMAPRMLSGHLQGRFLSFISKLIAPKNILEIGTFTGYSALCLAEGLPQDGKIITIERDVELATVAKSFFVRTHNPTLFDLRIGPALNIIDALLQAEVFDLVFIDANKEEYAQYYEACLTRLKRGGVILTDNVLWSGQVVDKSFDDTRTEALRSFNNFVATDARVEKLLLPVRDGIYCIRKK